MPATSRSCPGCSSRSSPNRGTWYTTLSGAGARPPSKRPCGDAGSSVTTSIPFPGCWRSQGSPYLNRRPSEHGWKRSINAYGKFLQENVELLWPARIILLTAVVLHILAAWQLTVLNKFQARPVAYVKKTPLVSTYAARTMVWSGPILGFFIIYHILHFTTMQAYPGVAPDDVYNKVIYGFQRQPAAAAFYIVANILLATHLYHGVWSLFQTLGISHPRYTPWIRNSAQSD